MKAEIVEIREWYNSKGELIEQTIIYESEREYGYFEQPPKTAKKWLERVKKSAGYINEATTGEWTRKIYRKECENE